MGESRLRLTAAQRKLKAQFFKERGFWNSTFDQLLAWDPEFFEAYLNLSAVPWRRSVLPPKVKELIYIAVDASATHLYAPGVRHHIGNALRLGATRKEILEVLELISVLGIHACTVGVPILSEELKNRNRRPRRNNNARRRSAERSRPSPR